MTTDRFEHMKADSEKIREMIRLLTNAFWWVATVEGDEFWYEVWSRLWQLRDGAEEFEAKNGKG